MTVSTDVAHTNGAQPEPRTRGGTVALRQPDAALATFAERLAFADELSKAKMLPRHLQGSPADVLFAMELADSLGIHHIQAFTSVWVVEGKPEASAELVRALILRAGHRFDVDMGDTKCVITAARRERPDQEQTFVWTIEDARTAGLANKQVWKSYPRRMLLARATSDAAVAMFPDVKRGMGVEGDSEMTIVDVTPEASTAQVAPSARDGIREKAQRTRAARQQPAPEPEAAAPLEAQQEQPAAEGEGEVVGVDQRTASDLRAAIMRAARTIGWDQSDVEQSFAQDLGGNIAAAPRDQLVAFAFTVEQLAEAKTEDPQ